MKNLVSLFAAVPPRRRAGAPLSRRSRGAGAALGLALMLGVAAVAPTQAAQPDFTLTQTVPASGDGTFELSNNSAGYQVDELVVAGLGAFAGTTTPGWSAEAFFFGNDPMN